MSMSPPVCDAHVHVFDPQKYPYVTPRRFTPGVASARDLQDHIRKLKISHVVLVQPSVYGDNNACLLNAMNELPGVAGGVVVISRATPSSEIDEMHHLGVRGARINLVVDHEHDPEMAVRKIQEIDSIIPEAWHIQLHVGIGALGAIFDRLEGTKRVFVLDHLGLPDVTRGTQSFAWQRLLRLVGAGNLFVKLSAPYLSSVSGPPYSDLEPFVNSLLRIRPDRLLWGSNWPHTQGTKRSSHACVEAIEAFLQVDDLQWLELCSSADEQASVVLFNENARRIYDFI
jgi:2-pyrone-4,6-dicarboxylate lactonase